MIRSVLAWTSITWMLVMPLIIHAQQADQVSINDIQLGSIHNKNTFSLKEVDSTLIALVFISPECPLSQNYIRTLNQLLQKFSGKLTVIGIFPGADYNDTSYTGFEQKYQASFTLVKDEKKLLTQQLNATVTPEVFLMNSSRNLIYSGAIDDWVVSLGTQRKNISKQYLEEAIKLSLAEQPVRIKKQKR